MKGASKHTNKAHLANGAGYGFCGGQLNSATGTARSTICCKFCFSLKLLHVLVIGITIIYKDSVFAAMQTPFSIRFISDHFEHDAEDLNPAPVGFRLTYVTSTC